jgi:hypothetical protein
MTPPVEASDRFSDVSIYPNSPVDNMTCDLRLGKTDLRGGVQDSVSAEFQVGQREVRGDERPQKTDQEVRLLRKKRDPGSLFFSFDRPFNRYSA